MESNTVSTQSVISERQKMLAGETYNSWDPELVSMREAAAKLTMLLNSADPSDQHRRELLTREIFGKIGTNPYITSPFHCDYGCHIEAGNNLYLNFGCVLLDCNLITIGDNVKFGPNVQLYAASHPTDPERRLEGDESAKAIKIGSNVWIGGGVIVCPGVTIGDHSTIGAGSVVTKDVPPCCVAAGNPCKVIRMVKPPPGYP